MRVVVAVGPDVRRGLAWLGRGGQAIGRSGTGNDLWLFVSAVLRETALCLHSLQVDRFAPENIPDLDDPFLLLE